MNLIPLVRKLRRGQAPAAIDFTALSFILYFDLGLMCEAANYKFATPFLEPYFSIAPVQQCFAAFLIAAAPWILRIGAVIGVGTHGDESGAELPALAVNRRYTFYLVMILICSATAIYGTHALLMGANIWADRAGLAATAGPYIVFLYIPMYVLGFYVQVKDASTFAGRCFIAFLIATAVLSTLSIGERTLILLPLLIVALGRPRVKAGKVAAYGLFAIILAVVLLPVFKWQFSTGQTPSEMLSSIIYGDFYRAPMLARSIDHSDMFGTEIMQYPGAGYIYAFLFPVPRTIAPFKGYSTASTFTAYLSRDIPKQTNWQLGISAIDELMLNFGYLFVIPGLIIYGAAFGFLGRAEDVIPGVHITPGLRLPLRLVAIWFLGYDLPALLLTYGFMAIACIVISFIWNERHGLRVTGKLERLRMDDRRLAPMHSYRKGPQSYLRG